MPRAGYVAFSFLFCAMCDTALCRSLTLLWLHPQLLSSSSSPRQPRWSPGHSSDLPGTHPPQGPLRRLDPSVLRRYLRGHAFTSFNFLSQGDLPGHHTQTEPSSGIPSTIPYFIFYMTLVTSRHSLLFACRSCSSRVSPARRALPESWVSSVSFTKCQTPDMVPGRW